MKEYKSDFSLFRAEFKRWQQRLGLTGYKVYFKYEPIEDRFADITTTSGEMVATARLNSRLPRKDKPFKNIETFAKHEALHLLLRRLEDRARSRYTSPDEIYESVEEVVFKLESLIK